MKTRFFKRLMMPLAVMVLGIAGAFTTTSMASGTEAVANVTGYRFVSQADPCHADIMCSTIFNPTICTSGGSQLWNKANPNVNVCDVPLYKIQ